jgi:hypothetical protein
MSHSTYLAVIGQKVLCLHFFFCCLFFFVPSHRLRPACFARKVKDLLYIFSPSRFFWQNIYYDLTFSVLMCIHSFINPEKHDTGDYHLLSRWHLARFILRSWRWRRYVHPETSFDFQRATRHYIPEEWQFYIKLIHCFTVKESPFLWRRRTIHFRNRAVNERSKNGLFREHPVAGSRIVCSCRRGNGIISDVHTNWEHNVVAGSLVVMWSFCLFQLVDHHKFIDILCKLFHMFELFFALILTPLSQPICLLQAAMIDVGLGWLFSRRKAVILYVYMGWIPVLIW